MKKKVKKKTEPRKTHKTKRATKKTKPKVKKPIKSAVKKKCPNCHSERTVWRGYRYNEKTTKRLRKCVHCGRKFTPDDGFYRMRFSPEEIQLAVNLYSKGFSSAEVVQHLSRKGIRTSRWTVLTWFRKYNHRRKRK